MPTSEEENYQRQQKRLMNEIMELLVTHFGAGLNEEDLDLSIERLQKSFALAQDSHSSQLRKSGEPYIFHPLRVAHLAARHWMGFSSIIAAILHDVVEDTPVTLEEVSEEFGEEVAFLVNGLTKVTDDNLSRAALKAETYRKTVLSAVEDVRILCLKFWDRIDNLRTIDALAPKKQSLIAEETRTVYVPLAQHLGMGYVASELDALSLNVIYPRLAATYRSIIEDHCEEYSPRLKKIRTKILNVFEHHKLNATLRDRWRPFSTDAAKQSKRGIPSLYTLEIQVDRMMDAYIALGLLHGIYHPIPGKLRDHLSLTSQYGYQALKTTVQAKTVRIRVEITTRKLARFNEAGVLAPGFEFRKENFRELMHSLADGESAFDAGRLRLASSTIQVYTPAGDIITLPEGSSVLDFAFHIHEKVGLNAQRARINGQTRQLKARLMDGDQIDVVRAPKATVLPKWLEWTVTPKARNAIRRYLRTRVKESVKYESQTSD